VPAKRDGFPLFVAAVRIPAIVAFKLEQREMARVDLDAAKRNWLGALNDRHRPAEFGRPEFGQAGLQYPILLRPARARRRLRPVRIRNPHPFGASDRGIAGVAGMEICVDGVGDLRIGQALGNEFPQRFRMFRRPVCLFHFLVPCLHPGALRPISDIPK